MSTTLVKIIRTPFALIEKILELLSMGMLLGMVIIICYQVIMRYVFNQSPSWTEEIAILLMIWFGILAIPIGVKHNLHIGIEYIFRMFPLPWQYAVSRGIYLLIAGFGLIMIVYGLELTKFMSMSTLPATKISSAVEYIVMPISGLMLMFNALELAWQSYRDYCDQEENPTVD